MGYKSNRKKLKQKQQVEHEEEKQPSAEKKEKQKQVVVYEEDYIPIKTLTIYGIDAKTVKTLEEVDVWNSLLLTNNKKLLAGIKGLPESMYDPICEAIDKIMVSVTSEVQEFTQSAVAAMEVFYEKKDGLIRKVIRATQQYVRDCYTFDEMDEALSREFHHSRDATQNIFDFFFEGKKGSMAYKQLSSIRSAQRKANQKDKHAAAEEEELAVMEKQAAEKEKRAAEKEKRAAEMEKRAAEMEKRATEKKEDKHAPPEQEELAEMEKQAAKKEEELAEMEKQAAEKKEEEFAEMEKQAAKKKEELAEMEKQAAKKKEVLSEMEKQAAEKKEEEFAEMEKQAAKKKGELAEMEKQAPKKEEELAEMEKQAAKKKEVLSEMEKQAAEKEEEELAEMEKQAAEKEEELTEMEKQDYLPIKTLTEYGIDAKTVKTLEEVDIWNSLLLTNDKNFLAGIKGLSESMYDPICEAIDKIMVSLTSEVKEFTQRTVAAMEDMYNEKDDDMNIRPTQQCLKDCYTFDEMHEVLSREFCQTRASTQMIFDHFFAGKEGSEAYKQLSSIRSAQRKAKQKEKHAAKKKKEELVEMEKQAAKKKEELAKMEKQAAKKKEKQKQVVVYEEDYIPIKTLTKYGIDAKTVKTLEEVDIWNSLLLTNNKKLLAGIKGLPESMYDPICEAIDKIMVSVTTEVQEFTQSAVAAMEVFYEKKDGLIRKVIRATQQYVRDCYTFDEMDEALSREFHHSRDATQNIFDFFFEGKKGSMAYKQLSSIRSAQRKANQKDKHAAAEEEELAVMEKQAAEKEKRAAEKKKRAAEKKKEELVEMEKQAAKKEELADMEKQDYLPIKTSLSQKEKHAAESLLPALSQQVITSQKTMMDAFAFQQKMVAGIMNSQTGIATNEDLESLQDGVGGRLESLGKALVADLTDAIQNELTSASTQLSRKAEKIISTKVKRALKKLDTSFKEKVEIESEARVANVVPGPKETMAMHLAEEEYEECFDMAGQFGVIANDSFGWLLTKLHPERLLGFHLSQPTIRALVNRLTVMVQLERDDVGLLYFDVYRSWFQAALDIVDPTDRGMPDWLRSRIERAIEHVTYNP